MLRGDTSLSLKRFGSKSDMMEAQPLRKGVCGPCFFSSATVVWPSLVPPRQAPAVSPSLEGPCTESDGIGRADPQVIIRLTAFTMASISATKSNLFDQNTTAARSFLMTP